MTLRSQHAGKPPWSSGARLIAVALGVALGLTVGAFYVPRWQGAAAHRDQVNAAFNAFMSLAFAAQLSSLIRLDRVGWASLIAVLAIANVLATGAHVVILAYGACALCAASFGLWAARRRRVAYWLVWLSGVLAGASKIFATWPR